jgi:hypothetical protein
LTELSPETVSVPCRLCGAPPEDAEPRCAREQDAGPPLGRVAARIVQCTRSGSAQQGPRPAPDVLARHDRKTGAVSPETGAGSRHSALADRRARCVRRWLPHAPGALLAVGRGGGDLLRALAPPGWEASGREPAPTAARRARIGWLLERRT